MLLLVGLMAGLVPVRAGAAPERIRLECQPAHLVLGTAGEVEVRVALAPDATQLVLSASAGQVGAPVLVSPGVYRATYVPPRRKLPEEVILAAWAREPGGEVDGWTVLPLWGQGVAEVRTQAGAPVSVQVGTRTFGPIPADARGLAPVPITVPPGVKAAFFGSRRIELGVPPWPYVHALASRPELRADREERVEVRLYLSRLADTPSAPAHPFTFTATRGTVSDAVEREPGVWLVHWTVPPGPAGPLTLRGSGGPGARWSFAVEVEATPGPAQRFELRLDREVLVAGERTRARVEVSARDGAGNPTRAGPRLESALSGASALEEQGPGEYATWLEFPARFEGRDTLELRLFTEGQAAPVQTRTLTLRAGELARVRMEPVRPVVVADGLSEAVWRIAVEDRFGNSIAAPRPEAQLPGGQEGTLFDQAPGHYELRYVPPESRVNRVSEVAVRVGPLLERGSLTLLRRSVLTLAPRLGVMTNLADVRALSAGLRLEAWPVRAWRAVGVWLDTGYLRFSRDGGTAVPGFSGDNEILDTALAVGLRTPREYAIQGWASAGLGAAWVRARVRWSPEQRELVRSGWVLGAQATLGVGMRAGPGQPFLEVRVFRFNDPALPVLRGALEGAGLHVGYRLELL